MRGFLRAFMAMGLFFVAVEAGLEATTCTTIAPAAPAAPQPGGVRDERMDIPGPAGGLPDSGWDEPRGSPHRLPRTEAVAVLAEPAAEPPARAAAPGMGGGEGGAHPGGGTLSREKFYALAALAGWPELQLPDVYYVACGDGGRYPGESGCDPDAWNGAGPFAGLLQAHWPFWWTYCGVDSAGWMEPVNNLRVGRCIWEYTEARYPGQGWSGPWPNTAPR